MKFKFVTVNIYNGGLLFPNLLKFLRRENPDILCFQEVYNSSDPKQPSYLRSLETLQQALPDHFSYFSPVLLIKRQKRSEGKIDIGNAILSQYPILDQNASHFDLPYGEYPEIPSDGDYSTHPQNCHWIDTTCNQKPLRVINVHGIWGRDGGDTPRRITMVRTILKQLPKKGETIIAGDFNVQPNTKTIGAIENKLTNVFKNELTTTFNMKHKTNPGYATAVVDMVFVSQGIKVSSHKCPDVNVSDHLPLVCEFQI